MISISGNWLKRISNGKEALYRKIKKEQVSLINKIDAKSKDWECINPKENQEYYIFVQKKGNKKTGYIRLLKGDDARINKVVGFIIKEVLANSSRDFIYFVRKETKQEGDKP